MMEKTSEKKTKRKANAKLIMMEETAPQLHFHLLLTLAASNVDG